jgi:urea transport system ATP-binding protein
MTSVLTIDDLHVSYGQSEVLHGLSLSLAKNEIIALMGRNGMGKTTLLKALIGLLPIRRGTVNVDNTDITGFKSYQRVAQGVAYVPQGRMVFSSMTVEENIETGLGKGKKNTILSDIYELFPVLKEMRKRRGGNLSGGQQQQLAIARALASEPKVLLLDEPTEGIQPSIIREMGRTLKRIRDERGLSILVSEQVLSFALDVADRVIVIENGNLVHEEIGGAIDGAKISSFLSV